MPTTAPAPATAGAGRVHPSRSAEYGRNRRRKKAYGTWEPYVDAEPVRAHVRGLMEYGVGWMRLAELSGIPQSTVEKLLYGAPPRGMAPSKRVRQHTADKLLALRPDPGLLAGATETDATGTRRRLHVLVAAGWPQSHLAARLGMDRGNFGKTLRSARVLLSTDRAVRALYDELWNLDPRDHGVSATSYGRARLHAHARMWAPAGAWDDDTIDDPEAFPDWTGSCGTPKGYRAHYTYDIPLCDQCRRAAADHRRLVARSGQRATHQTP